MNQSPAEFFKRFAENRIALVCLAITVLFMLCAIFAPLIAPSNPYDLARLQLSDSLLPTGSRQIATPQEVRTKMAFESGRAAPINGASGQDTPLTTETCGVGCLLLRAASDAIDIGSIEVRDLPNGVSVEGAQKHPIRPWFKVTDPADDQVRIVSDDPFPSSFEFETIARTTGNETGFTFLLGTDGFGRDMLSAILYGIRISMFVGIVAAGLAMMVGTLLGLISAWFGGAVDAIIMRAVDFMLGFPALLVGLVVLAVAGSGIDKIVLAVVAVQWAYYARTTRSVALVELNKEYVEAAKVLRFSRTRIMLRHVLPNCLPPLIVLLTLNVASAISLEASLSFLGMGLPLTEPSLGMLIANGYEFIFSNKYWISIYPGVVLLVMIISMNLLGDRLRDVNNPRLDT